MPKEALAKYKERSEAEIKERIDSLNKSIDSKNLFSNKNTENLLIYEIEKSLRDVPLKVKYSLIKKAEFVDRINDIEREDIHIKKAAINFLGEQGNEGLIPVLEELKEEEKAIQILTAITKAICRIIERKREPNFSQAELQGDFQPDRRPWRAMIRVTQVENENLRVILPGWNMKEEVQLNKNTFPKKLHQFLSPGERFFAKVNIGADEQSKLYFTDFEEKS